MPIRQALPSGKSSGQQAAPVESVRQTTAQPDAAVPVVAVDWPGILGRAELAKPAIVALQRTHGNAHVSRLIQRSISFADAKHWIKQASDGAGTDEDEIYDAIRKCADRAALKADPDVQRMLKSELSGHDLWKAQLLLEYGNESAFPATIKEIWSATKGSGTDEARIYKAINKLTASQLDALLKIPGLKGILKADLNKGEMKKATGGAGLVERHKQNVLFMQTELADMKKPGGPVLEKNTAEWIVPASGAAKLAMFVLTKTHDSAARAKKHGHAGERAYFGAGTRFPATAADYDLDIASTRNIHFSGSDVIGEQGHKKIWVMEPMRHGSTSVRSTLVHEVQHDADKHELDPGWSKAFKSPEESWVRYRTEFRAYWVDGGRDDKSATKGTATDPKFDNARQEAIFLHMYGSGPKDTYAVWLRPNYDGNTSVGGKKFKDLVHGYSHPEGINLINSPRIDDLHTQLIACKKTDRRLTHTPLKELKAAAQALDANDRLYLASSRAASLHKLMLANLAARPLRRIAAIVNGGTLPKWAGH